MPTTQAALSAKDLVRLSPELWASEFGFIRDVSGKKIPFKLNVLQKRIFALWKARNLKGLPVRAVGLKPRKRGFSTAVAALHYAQLSRNIHEGVIIGDKLETSDIVFRMIKYFAETDTFGGWGSPVEVTSEKIKWAHGSRIVQATARGKATCRGLTPQFMHLTEAAHYENAEEVMDAAMNAVPDDGFTTIFIESTPFGAGEPFALKWEGARWPKGWECPGGEEYWRQWESFAPDSEDAEDPLNDRNFVRVFAAWFEFEESRIRLSDQQKREIEATLDARSWYAGEEELIRRYGNEGPRGLRLGREVKESDVWEQLAWRRMVIRDKCRGSVRVFNSEHPSDPKTCVAGDIRVGTDAGLLPIRELKAGMMTAMGRVLAHEYRGERTVYRVTTKRGFELKATADHLVGVDGGMFCEVKDLIGRRVQLQRPRFADREYEVKWKGFGGADCNLVVNEDWGRFLGYFMVDGSLHRQTLSFVRDSKDQDVVEDICRLVRKLFGEPQVRKIGKTGGGTEIRISRNQFHDLFLRLGIIEKNPKSYSPHIRKVSVPECIFRSPAHVVREFLRGLFESNGHVFDQGTAAKFFSKHWKFSQDVQLLLYGMGIHSSILKQVKRVGERTYSGYETTIHRFTVEKFMDEIGFISERKRDRRPRKPIDGRAVIYGDLDEVVSVEEAGKTDVWDIQIEGDPVFDAGGILVHNCFLSAGRQVFDGDALDYLGELCLKYRGELAALSYSGGRCVFRPTGEMEGNVVVWEKPKVGCRYLLAVDPAEGEDQTKGEDPDRHAVQVWRDEYVQDGVLHLPRMVARVKSPCRIPIVPLARLIRDLSCYYGRCCVLPEMNNSGMALITALRMLEDCPPIWQRRAMDPHSGREKAMDGWRTTDTAGYGGVRSTIIWHLHEALREQRLVISCPVVVSELRNFVDKGGRMEAGGGHDDNVLCACIAVFNLASATPYLVDKRSGWLPPDLAKEREGMRKVGLAMRT